MLSSDFERFEGREVIVIEQPTVLLIVQGELTVSRLVEYFGFRWSVDLAGQVLLLPPATYVVEGRALILFAAKKIEEASPAAGASAASAGSSASPAPATRKALR